MSTKGISEANQNMETKFIAASVCIEIEGFKS